MFLFLILITVFIVTKQIRDNSTFSNTHEDRWNLNESQNRDATNWLDLWFELSVFDPKPTVHEIWEREIDYFNTNFTTSNQSDLMIRWLKRTFPEAPYMIYIANCESTGLVHRKNGKLLPNATGGSDRGVLQIHMNTHKTEIKIMGLNIEKNNDYFYFTRILFDRNGVNPWNASRHCWEEHYQRISGYI